jgi:hypothetical protein
LLFSPSFSLLIASHFLTDRTDTYARSAVLAILLPPGDPSHGAQRGEFPGFSRNHVAVNNRGMERGKSARNLSRTDAVIGRSARPLADKLQDHR